MRRQRPDSKSKKHADSRPNIPDAKNATGGASNARAEKRPKRPSQEAAKETDSPPFGYENVPFPRPTELQRYVETTVFLDQEQERHESPEAEEQRRRWRENPKPLILDVAEKLRSYLRALRNELWEPQAIEQYRSPSFRNRLGDQLETIAVLMGRQNQAENEDRLHENQRRLHRQALARREYMANTPYPEEQTINELLQLLNGQEHCLQPELGGESDGGKVVETRDKADAPALDYEEGKILKALCEDSTRLFTTYDLEAIVGFTRKTVGNRVNRLIGLGLAHRPKGKNGGVTITQQGKALVGTTPTPK